MNLQFIYIVHSPTNALFITFVTSFKFALKYTIISLLHVSVFSDHQQGALSVPDYVYVYVKTPESLFLKYVSTAKARSSTDQRSMATEMLWVSPEGRLRTNSSRRRFHSQLCCQIVRYFCRTLFKGYYCTSAQNMLTDTTELSKISKH